MGKGLPRAVEKGSAAGYSSLSSSSSSSAIPSAPVFHPTDIEFADPLAYIDQIRPLAEPFGICRIVPPPSWSPPFTIDLAAFSFPTKAQPIHRLQARPPSCDPDTFRLDYRRFLAAQLGRRAATRRDPVFDGAPLDLCRLFHAVKRFGGYERVCGEKQWGDVYCFLLSGKKKASDCSKHVLSQLYWEHLYDYEEHCSWLDHSGSKCKKGRSAFAARKRKRKSSRSDQSTVNEVSEDLDQICEQCKSGLHGEVMLLCDRCNKGWHLYCLSPPLESVPPGNWYCLECVNSDKDSFGFVPGKRCYLETFRRMDDRVRRKFFGQNATRAQIEKQFWEIVEGRAGELEVMYGSDLDTSVYGSGFPRLGDPIPTSVEPEVWREYCTSPWNLNNFPKLPGSMLRAVQENIAGVMIPWLYVGMLFSSFCWHVEDHCFYSINYLHWGEPKCWYGVPGADASAFEKVMRNALPDLFDVQPDLLFQLVTMLNPSILQVNGVPVYSVVQEPGNFVITFPRSFHGGYNLGLNCAEAVNFAPADWLPHGGVGAELYRLYRKAPVLSHEELLCVVAKNGCDAKTLPYLRKEIGRIVEKEKRCREELWVNGIVGSSLMCPKKHPEYVGTEEDPTCIICQQHLFLSAITCSCRPASYVCLEHWKHLCECSPEMHHLLYRHTLAELDDLVHVCLISRTNFPEETYRWYSLFPNEPNAQMKKMKGGSIAHIQLAESWLSNAFHILETPFENLAYITVLKEAEQFLWADHNMDSVRDMAHKLLKAQKWALNVRSCLSKMDDFLHSKREKFEKVTAHEVEKLLSVNPIPCCEPGLTKLQTYADDANKLIEEINSSLLSHLTIDELEILYSRAAAFPIGLLETEKLASEISFAKVWLKRARECLTMTKPGSLKISLLDRLKSEMAQLHIQLPEMDLFLDLYKEAESWKVKCKKYIKSPLRLKELEDFVRAADNAAFSIPELNLLRQYCSDTRPWICHLNSVLENVNEREDHDNIVKELSSIIEAGVSLRVQVDELPVVEAALKKSICRKNASEALSTRKPLEAIQQILNEASLLKIEEEQLFVELFRVLRDALLWEEKAKIMLEHTACLSDFEEVIRCSEDLVAVLPSLADIRAAVSDALVWLSSSKPYLRRVIPGQNASEGFLKVDDLKDLVAKSKCLKVVLDNKVRLQGILEEVDGWGQVAFRLLEESRSLLYTSDADCIIGSCLTMEELLGKINEATQVGLSLGFDLKELPELQNASITWRWILAAFSFCSKIPLLKDVDSLLEDVNHLPDILSDAPLARRLVRGTSWLRKALILLPDLQSSERCNFMDVKNILAEYQEVAVPFPMMVSRLQDAIKKHESWVERFHDFFRLPAQQSWTSLLKLRECGQHAFNCAEMDKVIFEIGKVEEWFMRCLEIMQPLVGDRGSLLSELGKIQRSLDKALRIYGGSNGGTRTFCVCCPHDLENEVYKCLICKDWYHFSCAAPPLATADIANEYTCPFCLLTESDDASLSGKQLLVCKRNRPEFKSFIELLSAAEGFYTGIQEVNLVEEIVKHAKKCKSYLMQIVNFMSSYKEKDLSLIKDGLLVSLKGVAVAGLLDPQDYCSLESVLAIHSWKINIRNLLGGTRKPTFQQILQLEDEGLALGVTSDNHFMLDITEVKQTSQQWLLKAKEVTSDSGEHALSEVYELMSEGEKLLIHVERELKLLRARGVLYCICRKPYDHRAMIACDQCDEWYHFDCINLCEPAPKTFFCPACCPANGDVVSLTHPVCNVDRSITEEGPQTPPTCNIEVKRRPLDFNLEDKMQVRLDLVSYLRSHNEADSLWRENKRPFSRTARRRRYFECLP